MNNSINLIIPYKENGVWAFDEPKVNLIREPFVGECNSMFDEITSVMGIKEAEKGFKLFFSSEPFPNYHYMATWIKQEYNGNWYKLSNFQCWLCSVLQKYYKEAPQRIYIRLESLI